MASDQGLHCLSVSHKKDARLIWARKVLEPPCKVRTTPLACRSLENHCTLKAQWSRVVAGKAEIMSKHNLAATENQICGCASREDPDQPRHQLSLISLHFPQVLSYPLSAQRRLCPV